MRHIFKKNKKNGSRTENKTTFFYYVFRNVVLVSFPLTIVCGLVLSHFSFHSSATGSDPSGTDNLTISIYSACTLSSTVNNEHNAVVDVGTYKTNIGKTTITTLCNDGNGYSVYANGFSNNEEGNNKLINSQYPEYSINTGLATSGLTSSWAMKLNNIENDPSPTPPTIEQDYNNTYGIVPQIWTKVAGRTAGTTDMDEGSSFTTTYAVYASSNQHAGTYLGQVKYVLIHPYRNDSTITTVPTFEDSFALSNAEKLTIDGTGYYKMQDMTSNICERISNTNETPTTQLVDIRDHKLYWVAKLADGKCWMTQNLDLAIGSTNVPLTSENTDISTTASGSGIYNAAGGYTQNNGVYTWTPDAKAITSNHIISNTSVPDWPNSYTVPYSAEAGDAYYYTSGTTGPETKTTLAQCIANGHTEAECAHYHAGNYYNWSAAIASNNSNGFSTNYNQASNSICPKGWRLPVASNSNQSVFEFGDLLYTYYHLTTVKYDTTNISNKISYADSDSFNKIRTAPLWFVRSGYVYNNTLSNSGVDGYHWSSTVYSSGNAYYLSIYNDGLRPAGNYYRVNGFPVRCIAR